MSTDKRIGLSAKDCVDKQPELGQSARDCARGLLRPGPFYRLNTDRCLPVCLRACVYPASVDSSQYLAWAVLTCSASSPSSGVLTTASTSTSTLDRDANLKGPRGRQGGRQLGDVT